MSTREWVAAPGPAEPAELTWLEKLFPAPRSYAVELWDGHELPSTGEATFRLVLKHPAALRRALTPPSNCRWQRPTSTATSTCRATFSPR